MVNKGRRIIITPIRNIGHSTPIVTELAPPICINLSVYNVKSPFAPLKVIRGIKNKIEIKADDISKKTV